jgi:hypothetical protein
MSTKFYSANEITLNIAGLDIGQGKAPDTFVEVEAVAERFSVQVGIDGESTISENRDVTHIVNVHLMQTSTDNDKLSAVMVVSEASEAAAVVPFILKDNQGTSLLMSLDSVIAGWPKQTFAKEAGEVVWKFFVLNPKRFVGGNAGT